MPRQSRKSGRSNVGETVTKSADGKRMTQTIKATASTLDLFMTPGSSRKQIFVPKKMKVQ